jgi:hypothetical protein
MPDDTLVPAIGTQAHGQPARLAKKAVAFVVPLTFWRSKRTWSSS